MIDPAIRLVESCDLFVVIDTSSMFIGSGTAKLCTSRTAIYLIDPKEVNTYRNDIHFIKAGASEGVKQLANILLNDSAFLKALYTSSFGK